MFDIFHFFKHGVKHLMERVSKPKEVENVIQIRDLHKSFGSKVVLDGVRH